MHYCQSCNLPLDCEEIRGTEKNGELSEEYCRNCYANGEFTNPKLTLEGMKFLIDSDLSSKHYAHSVIDKTLAGLNHLHRWRHAAR